MDKSNALCTNMTMPQSNQRGFKTGSPEGVAALSRIYPNSNTQSRVQMAWMTGENSQMCNRVSLLL